MLIGYVGYNRGININYKKAYDLMGHFNLQVILGEGPSRSLFVIGYSFNGSSKDR